MCIHCVRMVQLSLPFKSVLKLPLDRECYTSIDNCWWIITEKLIPLILEEFRIPEQDNIYDYRRYLFDNMLLLII